MSAYGHAGLRGEGCERMPNQLKPKKLDLPHLHPCSHRLQITLQGRTGKAKAHSSEGNAISAQQQAEPCVGEGGREKDTSG